MPSRCQIASRPCHASKRIVTDVSGRVARLYDTKNGMPRNVPLSTLAVAIVNHVAEDPEEKLFQINEGTLGIYWRKARSIAGINKCRLDVMTECFPSFRCPICSWHHHKSSL